MKRMILSTLVGLLGAFTVNVDAQVQKKPIDIEACMSWKRVELPEISPTGRFVLYRIVPMEFKANDDSRRFVHLYDTKTRKEQVLKDVEGIEFFDEDRSLFYFETDSTGESKTVLMELPSGKKTEWKFKEDFQPLRGTSYSASVTQVPEDTVNHVPAFQRLLVRDIKKGTSFHIDSIGYHKFYNKNRSIMFVRKQADGNALCYGPLAGPYRTLYESSLKGQPSSFNLMTDDLTGDFVVNDSLWFDFSLKNNHCEVVFDKSEVPFPEGMGVSGLSLSAKHSFATMKLVSWANYAPSADQPQEAKKDDSFELELWTWNEEAVPLLQRSSRKAKSEYPHYVYNRVSKKLTEVAPGCARLFAPDFAEEIHYVLYVDETPYAAQKEWLKDTPFDVYATNVHTGERRMVGQHYLSNPRWSMNGKWAVMYDPIAQVWKKFDGATGELTDISSAIGYPVHEVDYDKPNPAPAYGFVGWTSDADHVIVCDEFDWWKLDLTGAEKPVCITKGYGRKNKQMIRKVISNIDKDVFASDDKVMVSLFDTEKMEEGIYLLDMRGRLKKLADGPYIYNIHSFSDNLKYCIWNRQNISEFRDLWWSKSDFSNPVRITYANPQQEEYNWGQVKLVEWTNYENKRNKGLLYLPEDYDSTKQYPVLVQFYETHSGGMHSYAAPMLSSAMADVMYFVSNGYIVFMPDVHFNIGTPGQSSYDAVVSGTKYLIEQGIAHPGKIGLQGHSWSGFQTSYLVTKTDLFTCANIGAPITDMVTGYLGIRNGSGLPRYFMYEEWQSRMGKTIWEAKENYLANSALLEADKIHTPLLIFHNDEDEAVAYEQGRALYLAMRRLQRPAWLLNYKGEGHFVTTQAAQKDWTIRMKQFFDYYLKGTDQPRWMKEGIHKSERGINQKYDLIKK